VTTPAENGRPITSFSIKEILTDFVLPRLDAMDAKLDAKADTAAVEALRSRLELVERTSVSREEKHTLENKIAARFVTVEEEVRRLKEFRAGRAALVDSWRFWVGIAAVIASALILVYFHP
jgi:hypothetical protein